MWSTFNLFDVVPYATGDKVPVTRTSNRPPLLLPLDLPRLPIYVDTDSDVTADRFGLRTTRTAPSLFPGLLLRSLT